MATFAAGGFAGSDRAPYRLIHLLLLLFYLPWQMEALQAEVSLLRAQLAASQEAVRKGFARMLSEKKKILCNAYVVWLAFLPLYLDPISNPCWLG